MKRPLSRPPAAVLASAERASQDAQATLEDPGLKAAFARLQALYTEAMRRSLPSDRDGREGAYFMLRALDALAGDLAQTITGVAIARRNYRAVTREETSR